MHKAERGFTLVELSIVLVILGLLVGGVLSGQSLIRAAELRALSTEKDKYVVALNAFRDKYFALPGDLKNAFAFWGADCGTDSYDTDTGCNGDGNGKIQGTNAASAVSEGEPTKVWEHLSRAGLVEGSFDGSGPVLSTDNVPQSKFPQGAWDIRFVSSDDSSALTLAGNENVGHVVHLGGLPAGGAAMLPFLDTLTRGEAWNVDTKTDDGRANTGRTRGDARFDCDDTGTDYYHIAADGADFTGDCSLSFILN